MPAWYTVLSLINFADPYSSIWGGWITFEIIQSVFLWQSEMLFRGEVAGHCNHFRYRFREKLRNIFWLG